MADDIDDIKKDADSQRGKEAPENGEALTSEQEILQSIRDVLIQQTELVEGIESGGITKVGEILNGILSVEQQQLEISRLLLEMELDKLEQEDISKLKDLEESKKLLGAFQGIEQSIETISIQEGDEKGGGFGLFKGFAISRIIASMGGGAGIAFAGLGIGLGIGIIMVSFAGAAQMISNVNAEGIKDFMLALAEGMAAFTTRDLLAIGTMFGVTAVISLTSLVSVPRAFGLAASMTMLGLGLSGFMLGLGAGAALMDWLNLDLKNLPHVAQKLSETAGIIGDNEAAFTALGAVVAIGGLFAITSGGGATLSRQALASLSMTMGMTAVGLGIGGFFFGLGTADKGLSYLNTDWTSLPKAVEAMTQVATKLSNNKEALIGIGTLTAAGGIFGVVAMTGTKGAAAAAKIGIGATLGMGLIGAGIGAFFAGIGTGEGFMHLVGSDGTTLGNMMINIADGLKALEGVNASVLFGTAGIFASLGMVTGGALATGGGAPVAAVTGAAAIGAATGMGLAGYALGAFFTGFAMVGEIGAWMGVDGTGLKNIMINMGSGLSELAKVDGLKVMSIAGGLGLLGPAMLAFFGTKGLMGIVSGIKQGASDTWNWMGSLLGFDMESGEKTDKKGLVELLVDALKPFETLKVDGRVLMGLKNVNDLMINFFTLGDMDQREMDMIYYKNKWLIDQIVQRSQLLEMIHGGGNLADIRSTGPFRFADGAVVDTGIQLPNVYLKGFVNLEGTEEAVEELQKMLDVISFTPAMNTQNLQNPLIATGQNQILTDLRTVISNQNSRSVQVIAPNFGTASGYANSGGPGS